MMEAIKERTIRMGARKKGPSEERKREKREGVGGGDNNDGN